MVYPFGGGDLGSASSRSPGAREITTLSLEHAGDLPRLAKLDKKQLGSALADITGYDRPVSRISRPRMRR